MRSKISIFVFVLLFIVGCGVMNNPSDKKEIPDGALSNDEVFLEVSRISNDSLSVTNDNIGDMSIPELSSYQIFETATLTEQFLYDLNDSAQTLASGDLATLESWIKNIQDANISYQQNNFLFYPILQNENCGRKDSVSINDKNATITIQATTQECDTAFIYHVLMYKVNKSIENIFIKAFDEGTIVIPNSAK